MIGEGFDGLSQATLDDVGTGCQYVACRMRQRSIRITPRNVLDVRGNHQICRRD